MQSWLEALLQPISTLNQAFTSAMAIHLDFVQWNSQQAVLEKYLNDKYDPTQRRIIVETEEEPQYPFYIWDETENKPSKLIWDESEPNYDTHYIYDDSELTGLVHFRIKIYYALYAAFAFSGDLAEITKDVNRYALATKKWEFQTYI